MVAPVCPSSKHLLTWKHNNGFEKDDKGCRRRGASWLRVWRSVSACSNSPYASHHSADQTNRIGAALISIGCPVAVYALTFLCNDISGCPAPSLLSPSKLFTPPTFTTHTSWEHATSVLAKETGWPGWGGLVTVNGMLGTLAWYMLSLVLYAALPAQEVDGIELQNGGRLKYRFNAFSSAATILAICAAGTFAQGADFPVWSFINRNYVGLVSSNLLVSFLLAVYVYVRSFEVKRGNKELRELAAGGHSGNIIYDWFIGRELNPRITLPFAGEVDIKAWMELRPGMLGWLILDLAFMAKQYKSYGYVTDSMRKSAFHFVFQ